MAGHSSEEFTSFDDGNPNERGVIGEHSSTGA
jgi:hypothetical protein